MKTTLSFLLIGAFTLLSFAPGEEVKVKELTVAGIKVLFKPSSKEIISARLFIRGGTANYTKEKEGIESLALAVATEGGTTKHDMTSFATAQEKIGTEIGYSSDYDYSQVSVSCVTAYWNQSWDLFTEAINQPKFDPKAFELIKGRIVSNAKESEANPDSYVAQKAMELSYSGRNYSKDPGGTVKSLEALTLDELKSHYAKVVNKNNVFLVVVGNITEADLQAKVSAAFGSLPAGSTPKPEPKTEIPAGVTIENRDIATNYIYGTMSLPALNEPDAVPMRVAMSIMADKFFVELRTKRSLTYAPQAYYNTSPSKNPHAVFYASSTKPKESLQVMIDQINDVKNSGFKEKELKDKKEEFLTGYYSRLETNGAQSLSIGANEIFGNWKNFETFMKDVEKVTVADMNRVFKKYSNSINWMYLGKEADVSKEDFKQPQILPGGTKVEKKK